MKILLLLATALPFIYSQDMPGGQHAFEAHLTDDTVVFAVNEINNFFKANGDNKPRVADKVISATSQVVAGVIYRYKIEVHGGATKEICTVAVLSQPWLQKTQLQGTPSCAAEAQPKSKSKAKAKSLVGGQEATTLADPEVQKAVQFLETTVNAKSNSLFYLKAQSAASVTKQVVNGVIYRFNGLKFAASDCTQNDVKQGNKVCRVDANAAPLETCSYVVYWNPRQTPVYTINNSICESK